MVEVAPLEYLRELPIHSMKNYFSKKKQGNPKVPLPLVLDKVMK
jgi:hypothetical protein